MQRRLILIAVLALVAIVQATTTSWRVNPIGDARKANHFDGIIPEQMWNGGKVRFEIPAGKWNDITVTFWTRMYSTNSVVPQDYWRTVGLTYCPEQIKRNLPDELNGAGGWGVPGGVAVSGALAIPYTWSSDPSYTNAVLSTTGSVGEFGCYTINAIVANEMSISLGGIEHVLTPGTNNFNSYAGPSPYFTILGSGNVQIGMSKMYWHQYFDRINGVKVLDENGNDTAFLTLASIVTNELAFVSCRIHLDANGHWTRDDLIHYGGNDVQGKTLTNSLPMNASCRALDSRGEYYVGLTGLGTPDPSLVHEFFDVRVHPWWLTNEEVMRTFYNGKEEAVRRAIPQRK